MPTLAEQHQELDVSRISGAINTALHLLAEVRPMITVNGQNVALDLYAASGLGPILEAAQHIPTDPHALEQAVRGMLDELQRIVAIPELQQAVEVASTLEDIAA